MHVIKKPNIFIQENALENVVCEMAAICLGLDELNMVAIRKWPDYVWHMKEMLSHGVKPGRNIDWDAKRLRYFRTGFLLSLTRYYKIQIIEFHVPHFVNCIITGKRAVLHWHRNINVTIQRIFYMAFILVRELLGIIGGTLDTSINSGKISKMMSCKSRTFPASLATRLCCAA